MNDNDLWQKRKSALLESIDETMEKGTVDQEILESMKKLLDKVKIKKSSMEEYFDDLD